MIASKKGWKVFDIHFLYFRFSIVIWYPEIFLENKGNSFSDEFEYNDSHLCTWDFLGETNSAYPDPIDKLKHLICEIFDFHRNQVKICKFVTLQRSIFHLIRGILTLSVSGMKRIKKIANLKMNE